MNKRESQEKVMIKRTNAPERKKTAGTLKGLNDELREASIIRYWTGETQGFIFSRLLRCAVTGAEKVKDGKARKGKWQEQKKNLTKNTRQKDKKPITEFKQWIFRGKNEERQTKEKNTEVRLSQIVKILCPFVFFLDGAWV